MIKVTINRNQQNDIIGFVLCGHSNFSDAGSDIVCSAVSILVINTVNSIELFTDQIFTLDIDEQKGGFLEYSVPEEFKDEICFDSQLLLKSMVNGLKDVEKEYSSYIKISD